jgi:hypothetical protein
MIARADQTKGAEAALTCDRDVEPSDLDKATARMENNYHIWENQQSDLQVRPL